MSSLSSITALTIGKLLDHNPDKELFSDEDEEDLVSPELLAKWEKLDRDQFDVGKLFDHTLQDLDQITDFLNELEKFKPSQDLKLKKLIQLLTRDPVLSKHKVLIFSEFSDTARYIAGQLKEAGIEGVGQIDSGTSGKRVDLIQRFAPYYNESSSAALGNKEIRVLVATDVLSEGLNLQDATRLINYDLHWNPVRLMQRIGRVDRRMNPEIEARIVKDHPDQKELRGTVAYWNFLPPDDLDDLLRLYGRVLRGHSQTIGDRLAADLAAFMPLPAVPFDPCHIVAGRASSMSLVRYRTNDYSVPTAYAHQEVVIKGYVERVGRL